jgi:redox-sensitive bicupin YhaK (pirin superfamily)
MLTIKKYGLSAQGSGTFDGGKIKESKPISFRGEGSEVDGIGPLFYWALATSESDDAIIGLHPHRAFEIMSFVIDGELGHYDTAGNSELLHYGDVQIMQTGSGISHEERFHKAGTSIFQIWFEPNLQESITFPAVYHYQHMNGNADKSAFKRQIVGEKSVKLEADVSVYHMKLSSVEPQEYLLEPGRVLAMVPFKGKLKINDSVISEKEFVLVESENIETIHFLADGHTEFVLVDVPKDVDYPLLRK